MVIAINKPFHEGSWTRPVTVRSHAPPHSKQLIMYWEFYIIPLCRNLPGQVGRIEYLPSWIWLFLNLCINWHICPIYGTPQQGFETMSKISAKKSSTYDTWNISGLYQQFLWAVSLYSKYEKADYATKTLVISCTVSKNHSVQGITVLKEFINPNMYVVLTLLSASPGSEKNQPIRGLLKVNYTGLLKALPVQKSVFSYFKFKI